MNSSPQTKESEVSSPIKKEIKAQSLLSSLFTSFSFTSAPNQNIQTPDLQYEPTEIKTASNENPLIPENPIDENSTEIKRSASDQSANEEESGKEDKNEVVEQKGVPIPSKTETTNTSGFFSGGIFAYFGTSPPSPIKDGTTEEKETPVTISTAVNQPQTKKGALQIHFSTIFHQKNEPVLIHNTTPSINILEAIMQVMKITI